MTSGGVGLGYELLDSSPPWGGDLRHKQGDLDGGTDLYDLREAWRAYGEELRIKSGQGWSAVKAAHADDRYVVIQGQGNVPGSATYTGPHACGIGPETNAAGDWLWMDPLASGWQWVPPAKVRAWAEAFSSGVAFATGRRAPAPTPIPPIPPEPEPGPEPGGPGPVVVDCAPLVEAELVAAGDRQVVEWVAWLDAGAPAPEDHWNAATWGGPVPTSSAPVLYAERCAGACWARGPIPEPAASAYQALTVSATWTASAWRAGLWRADA